jgi:hypothetical protein
MDLNVSELDAPGETFPSVFPPSEIKRDVFLLNMKSFLFNHAWEILIAILIVTCSIMFLLRQPRNKLVIGKRKAKDVHSFIGTFTNDGLVFKQQERRVPSELMKEPASYAL